MCLLPLALTISSVVHSKYCCQTINFHKKSAHYSILFKCHWLPVSIHVQYNILLLTFKALKILAPSYLSDLLSSYILSYSLRSFSSELLCVPRFRQWTANHFLSRHRNFGIHFPWHSEQSSFSEFKSKFKTCLFNQHYH